MFRFTPRARRTRDDAAEYTATKFISAAPLRFVAYAARNFSGFNFFLPGKHSTRKIFRILKPERIEN